MIAQEMVGRQILLKPEQRNPEVIEFEGKLKSRIVGQDEAITQLVGVYQTVLADMNAPGRPVSTMLFLGPTGSGKTRTIEAAAEILFGSPHAFIKVDCAEYQHSHEIAKLIGSPPGYIGHRETQAALTQEALDRFHTDKLKLGFVLFDEIEKASDSVWQLLLGILDKATLTLGDNHRVDFSRTVVVLTSNLGANDVNRAIAGGIGFAPPVARSVRELDRQIHRVAVDAATRKFSPEFMNRIDKVVVYRTLSQSQLEQILDIELNAVQRRILETQKERLFVFHCTLEAKRFLLAEGTDYRYGARHLKRAIERHLVFPLSALMASEQIGIGDILNVDADPDGKGLTFSKDEVPRVQQALGPASNPIPLESVPGRARRAYGRH